MKTNKKKLSLTLQAILDAKTIITAALQTVKKELTESISKSVKKKLSLNFYEDLELPVEDEYVADLLTPVELVDEFLDDYMTPEETEDLEWPVIELELPTEDLTEDELLFDLTELELPVTEEDLPVEDEDEELNLDDIDLMVSKLREEDLSIEDDDELLGLIEDDELPIELNAELIGVLPVSSEKDTPMAANDAMINKYLQIKKLAKHYYKELRKAAKIIVLQRRQLKEAKQYVATVSKALELSKLLTLKSNCISAINKKYNMNLNAIKTVIAAFDKANSKEQVKLVYEAINNTLKNSVSKNTKSINLNVIGSRGTGSTRPTKKIVNEVNRFQELANLK